MAQSSVPDVQIVVNYQGLIFIASKHTAASPINPTIPIPVVAGVFAPAVCVEVIAAVVLGPADDASGGAVVVATASFSRPAVTVIGCGANV